MSGGDKSGKGNFITKNLGGNTPNEEQKLASTDPNDILARMAEFEQKLKTQEQENLQLKEQLKEVETKANSAEQEAAVSTGRRDVGSVEKLPYPTLSDDRPSYIKLKEKEFAKYGVGEKDIIFDMIGVGEDNTALNQIQGRDKVTYDGRVINLLYAVNHDSPFVIDHPKDENWIPEMAMILFDSGRLTVSRYNPSLQRFLLSHSKYGQKWQIYDAEAEAVSINAQYEKMDNAIIKTLELFNDKTDKYLPRYFAFHALSAHKVQTLSDQALKLELRQAVMNNPSLFETYDLNKNKSKFLLQKALERGFLKMKGDALVLSNGSVLCGLDGKEMYEAFADNCIENPVILQAVKEKVGTI